MAQQPRLVVWGSIRFSVLQASALSHLPSLGWTVIRVILPHETCGKNLWQSGFTPYAVLNGLERGWVAPWILEPETWNICTAKFSNILFVLWMLFWAAEAPRGCSGHLFFEQEANEWRRRRIRFNAGGRLRPRSAPSFHLTLKFSNFEKKNFSSNDVIF